MSGVQAVDLRRSFEGFVAMVTQLPRKDERSSQVFMFTNKRRDRVRLLYWEASGLWLMTRRLELGMFAWPKTAQADA